jgi:arylsulfatase
MARAEARQGGRPISADLKVPAGGAEGAIVATGATTGGYSLYVKDGRLGYVYNYLDIKYFTIEADQALPTGDVNVVLEFEKTGGPDIRAGKGAPGTARLFQNGQLVGSVDMDVTVPHYGDSVSKALYKPPFDFTGVVKQVAFDLSGDAVQDAEAEMRRAMAKQ